MENNSAINAWHRTALPSGRLDSFTLSQASGRASATGSSGHRKLSTPTDYTRYCGGVNGEAQYIVVHLFYK